jgi:serine/threonine protein kinase
VVYEFLTFRFLTVQNILIGEGLSLSLCDFGFATRIVRTDCNEWCGSPFTVSPEILNRIPYSPEAVDVWALGSVLYTMLCGAFPFQASNPSKVYERTKRGRIHSFPSHVSRTARDLVSRCLTVEANKRISVAHILKHPFFWDDDEENEEEPDEETAGECSGDEWCALSQESGEGLSDCENQFEM